MLSASPMIIIQPDNNTDKDNGIQLDNNNYVIIQPDEITYVINQLDDNTYVITRLSDISMSSLSPVVTPN